MSFVNKYPERLDGLEYNHAVPTERLVAEGLQIYSQLLLKDDNLAFTADVITVVLIWKMFLRMANEQANFKQEVYRRLADLESRFSDRSK